MSAAAVPSTPGSQFYFSADCPSIEAAHREAKAPVSRCTARAAMPPRAPATGPAVRRCLFPRTHAAQVAAANSRWQTKRLHSRSQADTGLDDTHYGPDTDRSERESM